MTRSNRYDSDAAVLVGGVGAVVAVAVGDDDIAVGAGVENAFADVVVVAAAAYACPGVDWTETLAVALSRRDLVVSKEVAAANFGAAALVVGRRKGGSPGSKMLASLQRVAALGDSWKTRMGYECQLLIHATLAL